MKRAKCLLSRVTIDAMGLESSLLQWTGPQLAAIGHQVSAIDGANVGGSQVIMLKPDPKGPLTAGTSSGLNGVYRAASDMRYDGEAVGW